MIRITPTISIDEKEILYDFTHASGPGGQNVNKVATAVQLRFNVRNSASLPEDVRNRLIRIGGKRVNQYGVIIIHASRFRTQERNRKDAIERLIGLITRAAEKPRKRYKTMPTVLSKKRRLARKRRHSTVKRLRRSVSYNED